MELTPCQV
jgi:hypothetical protein